MKDFSLEKRALQVTPYCFTLYFTLYKNKKENEEERDKEREESLSLWGGSAQWNPKPLLSLTSCVFAKLLYTT